jgi:hypothetical protein
MGRILATPVDPTLRSRKRTKSDLAHLRALPGVEPATSTGRVAWIWPEIEAGLATAKNYEKSGTRSAQMALTSPIRSFGSTYRVFEAVGCANARSNSN